MKGLIATALSLAVFSFGSFGACGSKPDPRHPNSGNAPIPADDASVTAFRGELGFLTDAFRVCHNRARAIRYNITGTVDFEVTAAKPPAAIVVKIVNDNTGSEVLAECTKARMIEHDWAGIIKAGQIFRSSLSFPERGPNIIVVDRDLEPTAVSETFAITTFINQANSGNNDASLAIWRLANDLPAETQTADEVMFVLSGEGKVVEQGKRRRASKLTPGSAVYVPQGATRAYEQSGDEPLVAVVVYAPAGAEQRLLNPAVDAAAEGNQRKKRRKPSGKVVVKQTGKIKPIAIADKNGEVRKLLGKKDKAEVFLGAVTLFANAEIPIHRHDDSSEILYVIEGGGEMTVGADVFTIGPGTAIQIPRATDHAFKSTAATATKAIQLYVPRGPEERFGKGKAK